MMRKDPCPWRKRRANCIPIEDESRSSNTKISWWEGSLSFFFCTHLQNQSTKSKIGSKRKPNKQRALNQNETLAVDLATISGPEVTHQAVDFGFGGRNLVRCTWGLGLIVIVIEIWVGFYSKQSLGSTMGLCLSQFLNNLSLSTPFLIVLCPSSIAHKLINHIAFLVFHLHPTNVFVHN